jgi:hypothetical protein
MADAPKIEVKPKELTEAEKAAQKPLEKTPEQLKKEQEALEREAREKEAQKVLEETRKNTRASFEDVKSEIAPEQIIDLPTLDKTL